MKTATLVVLCSLLLFPWQRALIMVEPDAEEVEPGDAFWVTLWAIGVAGVDQWQGELTWDGSVEPTRAVVLGGLFPACDDQGAEFSDGTAALWQSADKSVTGCGRLAAVEFEAVGAGATTFRFERVSDGYLLRPDGTAQPMIAPPVPCKVVSQFCEGDFTEPWGFRDLADVMAMAPAYGSACGCSGYNELMDIDEDCDVDLADVMAVMSLAETACP